MDDRYVIAGKESITLLGIGNLVRATGKFNPDNIPTTVCLSFLPLLLPLHSHSSCLLLGFCFSLEILVRGIFSFSIFASRFFNFRFFNFRFLYFDFVFRFLFRFSHKLQEIRGPPVITKYDSSKAEQDLGLQLHSLDEVKEEILKVYDYFLESGVVKV